MTQPSCCECCGRAEPTTHYVDLAGRPQWICGRCLDVAVERRTMEMRLHLMGERLKAQSAQFRRIERENATLRASLQDIMAMFGDNPGGTR